MLATQMELNSENSDWSVSSDVTHGQEEAWRGEFLRLVYSTYRKNFWTLYRLAIPAAIFALLINNGRVYVGRELMRGIARFSPIPTRVLFALGVWNLSTFFLAWFLQTFAFAAICATVSGVSTTNETLNSDGYARARDRVNSVLYVAFATYLRFVVLFAIAMYLILPAAFRILPQSLWANPWLAYAESAVVVLMIAAAIMGHAFAIPIVVITGTTGHDAMKTSWRMSDGHEGQLFRLIVESFFAGALGAYAASWALYFLLHRVDLHGWAGWMTAVVTTLVGAAAEIPMFLGFSLLYERAVAAESEVTSAAR
jgi:hypothetical protein